MEPLLDKSIWEKPSLTELNLSKTSDLPCDNGRPNDGAKPRFGVDGITETCS